MILGMPVQALDSQGGAANSATGDYTVTAQTVLLILQFSQLVVPLHVSSI